MPTTDVARIMRTLDWIRKNKDGFSRRAHSDVLLKQCNKDCDTDWKSTATFERYLREIWPEWIGGGNSVKQETNGLKREVTLAALDQALLTKCLNEIVALRNDMDAMRQDKPEVRFDADSGSLLAGLQSYLVALITAINKLTETLTK